MLKIKIFFVSLHKILYNDSPNKTSDNIIKKINDENNMFWRLTPFGVLVH